MAGSNDSVDATLAVTPNALSGFTDASSYDKHRPSYPPEAVDYLLKSARIAGVSGSRILEIAAGTGKFTALLAAREEKFEILATEPHDEMRKVLMAKQLDGVKVVKGFAEDLSSVADGWADAIIIAQAFHWFANPKVLQELHRKVAPGGVLALIWNVEDYNSEKSWKTATKWEQKLNDIIWATDDDDPRFRHEQWQQVFDDQLKASPLTIQTADPLFSLPIGQHTEQWTVWLPSKEAVWDRYHTISHIANLKGDELEKTKRTVLEALDDSEVEKNDKGEIAVHGRTVIAFTSAIPGETLRQGG